MNGPFNNAGVVEKIDTSTPKFPEVNLPPVAGDVSGEAPSLELSAPDMKVEGSDIALGVGIAASAASAPAAIGGLIGGKADLEVRVCHQRGGLAYPSSLSHLEGGKHMSRFSHEQVLRGLAQGCAHEQVFTGLTLKYSYDIKTC